MTDSLLAVDVWGNISLFKYYCVGLGSKSKYPLEVQLPLGGWRAKQSGAKTPIVGSKIFFQYVSMIPYSNLLDT